MLHAGSLILPYPAQSHRCQIRVHRSNGSRRRDMDIARSSFDTLRRPLAAPRRLPGFSSFQLARFALSCLLAQTACRRGSTVEQLICNQWVAGSIPVAGTIKSTGHRGVSSVAFCLLIPFCPVGAMWVLAGRRPRWAGSRWMAAPFSSAFSLHSVFVG